MKRFVVRVQAGNPKETRKAREVRAILQQITDTFISPMLFDLIGLHRRGCGCKRNCDGTGSIPKNLIFGFTGAIPELTKEQPKAKKK